MSSLRTPRRTATHRPTARRSTAPRSTARRSTARRGAVHALAGVLAPVSFVGAWLLAGSQRAGYRPTVDHISQLAREGSPHRWLMSSGFAAFGLLAPVFAPAAARAVRSPAVRWSITTAGVTTLLVGVTPLARQPGGAQDTLHGLWAGSGYLAMALTPLLAAVALRRDGRTLAAAASTAVGAVSAASLVASVALEHKGLYQRLGLGVVDLWFVAVATALLTGRTRRR